ncbi:MAG TPA: hypothetical protein VMU32_06605 [Solirubrobacteraceae bacterium]|nr:hypothetical protein [Solirubrobacteraceae bacterium]
MTPSELALTVPDADTLAAGAVAAVDVVGAVLAVFGPVVADDGEEDPPQPASSSRPTIAAANE